MSSKKHYLKNNCVKSARWLEARWLEAAYRQFLIRFFIESFWLKFTAFKHAF